MAPWPVRFYPQPASPKPYLYLVCVVLFNDVYNYPFLFGAASRVLGFRIVHEQATLNLFVGIYIYTPTIIERITFSGPAWRFMALINPFYLYL